MSPEERKMLEETRILVEENAVMLRSIQKSQRANVILKVVYWVVILAMSFGAYYLIQPYVDTLKNSVSQITGADALTGLGQ